MRQPDGDTQASACTIHTRDRESDRNGKRPRGMVEIDTVEALGFYKQQHKL